jgi:hypothetical protein
MCELRIVSTLLVLFRTLVATLATVGILFVLLSSGLLLLACLAARRTGTVTGLLPPTLLPAAERLLLLTILLAALLLARAGALACTGLLPGPGLALLGRRAFLGEPIQLRLE